jgi:hypothetical protein
MAFTNANDPNVITPSDDCAAFWVLGSDDDSGDETETDPDLRQFDPDETLTDIESWITPEEEEGDEEVGIPVDELETSSAFTTSCNKKALKLMAQNGWEAGM